MTLRHVYLQLKNKPHPRWTQAGPPDKSSARPQEHDPAPKHQERLAFPLDTSAFHFSLPSPVSSPVSAILTPTEEISSIGNDLDLASLFMSCPSFAECDESLGFLADNPNEPERCLSNSRRPAENQCGCLGDPVSYTAILELSLRLRDILGCLDHHRLGGRACVLLQRITDLDHLAK